MLPTSWHTQRLLVQDASQGDAPSAHSALLECQDVGPLDPAFNPVPLEEIEAHITRSLSGQAAGHRTFQMQMLRLQASGDVVGYWHFQRVPDQPTTIGISIMLIRPDFWRHGFGRELISAAVNQVQPGTQALWARVYLANPRAIAFWASQGFLQLAAHRGVYVTSPGEQPSIILARDLERQG